jgi:hypothetical protein
MLVAPPVAYVLFGLLSNLGSLQASERGSDTAALRALSPKDLVESLLLEKPSSKLAAIQSRWGESFDLGIEEIVTRSDIQVVEALMDRINDERIVLDEKTNLDLRCRYGISVRLMNKVRYALRLVLAPEDFAAIVGDSLVATVDVEDARNYFDRNRAGIAARLRSTEQFEAPR